MREPVVVIGAGAAGVIAAWRAATLGAKVVLLEKTPRIGTKILISGGGKCNITHDGPMEDVLRAFKSNEARFIRPACYRFTNAQVVEALTSRGLDVYTRPDGRIFPTVGTAKDVVSILAGYLYSADVDVRLRTGVRGIEAVDGRVSSVQIGDEELRSHHVILAVGGSSYPSSGTTGDGFVWANALGHTIEPIRAALAPIDLESPIKDFAGVALRDCILKARQAGKEVVRWRGDMLFTHRGISGPTTLGISRSAAEAMEKGPTSIEVDVYPDLPFEALRDRLAMAVREHPRKLISTHLEDLPERLVPIFLASAQIASEAIGTQFTQKERNRLVETLKGWNLGLIREVVLPKGEVVAGGVSLDEVDPQTMRSSRVHGLYLCGEVLDVAGPVGGYNLQAAFSTGFVAGDTAAKAWLTEP